MYKYVFIIMFFLSPSLVNAGNVTINDEFADIVKGINIISSKPTVSNYNNDYIHEVNRVKDKIINMKNDAIPLLIKEITTTSDTNVKQVLWSVLGELEGEIVDKALFNYFCYHRESNDIGDLLLHRATDNGSLNFDISDDQIQILINRIEKEDIRLIRPSVCILMMCSKYPEEVRVEPILQRYEKEVRKPTNDKSFADFHIYDTPKVDSLLVFMYTFERYGLVFQPYIKKKLTEAINNNDTITATWLYISLGMTQDPSAASSLKNIVENDPDPYTRGAAIPAYALSAKKEAIPLLRQLLDDNTTNEYVSDESPNKYFIAGSARIALFSFANEVLTESPLVYNLNNMLLKHKIDASAMKEIDEKGRMEYKPMLEPEFAEIFKKLKTTQQLAKAFQKRNINFILSYIDKRNQIDAKDIYSLLLRFNISISQYKFDDCINIIDDIISILQSDTVHENAYKKYSNTILYEITGAYNHACSEYILLDKANKPHNGSYKFPIVLLSYLLEYNKVI